MPTTTQSSLLSRVRDFGDSGAWQEFDSKYRDLILRYCRRRGLQTADAEDVRQMVMLNLAKALREFQYRPQSGRFRDYLGRVVANAIHRCYRRSPTVAAFPLDTEHVQDLAAPAGEAEQQWEREWMMHHYRIALHTLRSSLDPGQSAILEGLLAGRTLADLAVSSRLSEAAVRRVKRKLCDRLRILIGRQLFDEEAPDAKRGS